MRRLALVSMSIFLIVPALHADNIPKNLCRSEEIEIGSCVLENMNRKNMSICSNAGGSLVSYRENSSTGSESEIRFSSNRKLSRWKDSVTRVTFLGFDNGGLSYVLGIPQETLDAKAFMFNKKARAPLDFNSPALCASNSFGEKDFLSEAIQDVDDRVIRNGGFIFPPD